MHAFDRARTRSIVSQWLKERNLKSEANCPKCRARARAGDKKKTRLNTSERACYIVPKVKCNPKT